MSEFVPIYDLESLNEEQKQQYIRAICKHLGVPPELNLVMLTMIDNGDGPRRLVAYAKRGATEIVRDKRGIHVVSLTREMVGGSIVFTATGKDSSGRQEISVGSKYIEGLKGQDLDDAIMTAQTRATRRMTLQFMGAGVLDESEVIGHSTIMLSNPAPTPTPAIPTITPNPEPGKDVTDYGKTVTFPIAVATVEGKWKTQDEFETFQKKLRDDAIAQLNKQKEKLVPTEFADTSKSDPAPKAKKKPGRKAKVDMGPSAPAPVVEPQPIIQAVAPPLPPVVVTPVPAPAAPPLPVSVTTIGSVPKPKLTPAELMPYRQRLAHLINDLLEPAGFVAKEGVGNYEKIRMLAMIRMPGITNFTEIDAAQWDKFLGELENKVKTQGAVETIKSIEEAIGI